MKVLSCWMPGCFYRLYFVAAAVTTTYRVEETDRIPCFSSWLDVFYARCNWTCQTRGIGEQNLYNARCLNASLHGKRHKTRSIWNTKNAWNLAGISFSTTTVYPKKYAHGFCFAVLCCGYTLTDFPISIRLTSLALWQSNDCPSASKATLMNMDKYFMWIHYERLHNHNKAKHNKTVCIFLGIYCTPIRLMPLLLPGIMNCIHYQVWDDITLPFPNINPAQITTMQPVKFGNGLVISLCTLLGM